MHPAQNCVTVLLDFHKNNEYHTQVAKIAEEFAEFAPGIRQARAHGRREKNRETIKNNKFSEWGLPGGQIVGAPRESIFRLSRGSQLPYTSKYVFGRIYYQI